MTAPSGFYCRPPRQNIGDDAPGSGCHAHPVVAVPKGGDQVGMAAHRPDGGQTVGKGWPHTHPGRRATGVQIGQEAFGQDCQGVGARIIWRRVRTRQFDCARGPRALFHRRDNELAGDIEDGVVQSDPRFREFKVIPAPKIVTCGTLSMSCGRSRAVLDDLRQQRRGSNAGCKEVHRRVGRDEDDSGDCEQGSLKAACGAQQETGEFPGVFRHVSRRGVMGAHPTRYRSSPPLRFERRTGSQTSYRQHITSPARSRKRP